MADAERGADSSLEHQLSVLRQEVADAPPTHLSAAERASQAQARRLLDLLVRAGAANQTTVAVNGVTYRYMVENEMGTDTTAERRDHSVLRSNSQTLLGAAAKERVLARFQRDEAEVAAAFAAKLARDLQSDLHPHESVLERFVEQAVEFNSRLDAVANGAVGDAVGKVEGAVATGVETGASHLRPVAVAVRFVARGIDNVLSSSHSRVGLFAIIAGAAITLGTSWPLIVGGLVVSAGREVYAAERSRMTQNTLTNAARIQLTPEQRLTAIEGLAHWGHQQHAHAPRSGLAVPGMPGFAV